MKHDTIKVELTEKQELKLLRSLARKYPKEIQKYRLSNQQMEVLDMVRSQCHITSNEVSKRMGVSISHASNLLNQLYSNKWISRFEQIQTSGGTEWAYCKK